MSLVTYIDSDGTRSEVDVPSGESVMRAAVDNLIVGECGGGLACATCHCYVDERWLDRVGAPSQAEAEMLESAASERKHNSRLSCQIIVCDELDGLIVYLPPTQI